MFGFTKQNIPDKMNELQAEVDNLKVNLNYQYVLEKTLLAIASDLNFESITQQIVDLIVRDFKYAAGVFFSFDKARNFLYSHTVSNTLLINTLIKTYTKTLRAHGEDVTTGHLHYVLKTFKEKKIYEGSNLAEFVSPTLSKTLADLTQVSLRIKRVITLPVMAQEDVLGVIMFTTARNSFTEDEKSALETFTSQISLSIRNSLLYSEVNHQVYLLEAQNHDLSSLYNLTSQISKSLDPEEVAQTAVNSLPQDKLMIGAILSSYDQVTGAAPVHALTENQLSYQVKKIIGDFSQYAVNINDIQFEKNPVYKAIKFDSLQMTNNLEDFLSPPVPKRFVGLIAEILKINSVITYPVKARGVIIGAITYLIKDKTFEQVSDNDKQLLETYTNQITIALENANLYKQSQVIQKSLSEALDEIKERRRFEQDMIDVMGHELRTPMSIVRNALSMMELEIKNKGEISVEHQKKYTDMGLDSARREVNLIETLLSATKSDGKGFQLILEKIDLLDVINTCLLGAEKDAQKKGLELHYERPEKDMFVYGDRTRIQEVADNFLSNAVKYTEKGSVTLSVYEKDGLGWIAITDTGVGISQEDVEKLGQKFFRANQYTDADTKASTIIRPGGTGLGLYVSFSLVKVMEGKFAVQSKVGEGSTFEFGLPLYTNQETVQVLRKAESYFSKNNIQ